MERFGTLLCRNQICLGGLRREACRFSPRAGLPPWIGHQELQTLEERKVCLGPVLRQTQERWEIDTVRC
jgi:hypothetical protein